MKTAWERVISLSLLSLLVLPASVPAQDAEQLAKQTQNPVASLISVPLQGNWDFGLGDRDAIGSLLNFQPVMPFALNSHTNIILRVIVPVTSQPLPSGERINGVGDIVTTVFFSPANSGRIIWGAGPVMLLPTATNSLLGSEKIGFGPSIVVLTQPDKWTIGLLANQIWSVDGVRDRTAVNQAFLQPFVNYNLGNGVAAGATMEASASWEADQTWTAPLLFSISKVALLGNHPVNFQVAAGPVVTSPDGGARWRFRAAATFLFPR